MHAAPHDERPVGTMPDAAHQEGHEDIPIVSSFAATVAAQRNVNVLREPSGQRNVPTLPKVSDANGKIRSSEVVGQIETKCPSDANGHQGITCKVAINLQSVEHTGHKTGGTIVVDVVGINRIYKQSQAVCNHQLNEHTP